MSAGVTVVYLGRLADVAGRSESVLASEGDLDWPGLLALLDNESAGLADAAADARVKLALNGVVLEDRRALVARPGDEIALLPPVSGG